MAEEPPPRGSADPAASDAAGAVSPSSSSAVAEGVSMPAPRASGLYAALDLGTNNCRLLIARPDSGSFRVVDAFSRIVRLGEGLAETGRLSQNAMDRAIEALKVCRTKLVDRRVGKARLIATEASRAAENGRAFLDRVRAETGLILEMIDRETEARLAAEGCAPLADPRANGVVLFDIGGGSTELVWMIPRGPGKAGGPQTAEVRAWISLPVGVVTLAERHGGRDVTPAGFKGMVDEVADLVAAFPAREAMRAQLASLHLLGTSGTVTTLAGLHLDLPRYDRRRVDGLWLSRDEVDSVMGRLVAMDYDARVANACIGAERADLVLAGCAIFEGIRRHFPCERLRVADRGLREGILIGLMRADGAWRRRGHPQFHGRRP